MNGTPAVLAIVVAALNEAGIPHMLAGSFASSIHGAPRTTNDVDLVIDPLPRSLEQFLDALDPERFYVPVNAAHEALRTRDQFNVIDASTGWKVDLVIRRDRPFSRAEFERRTLVELDGLRLFVATVEDTILAKLEWAALGGSARQLDDVGRLVAVRRADLDRAYLRRWAVELGVSEDLEAALAE